MKVIFLDIDGVLNHKGCKEKIDDCYFVEEPLIMNLVNLIEETGAKVVLSSTWRLGWLEMDSGLDTKEVKHFKALRDKLANYGIEFLSRTPIMTPNNDMRERGKEIKSWLEHWGGETIESFVILDDLDYPYLQPYIHNVVHTEFSNGLTAQNVREAIIILNQKEEQHIPGYILTKIPRGCNSCEHCQADFDYDYLYCSLVHTNFISSMYTEDGEPNEEYEYKRLDNCPIKPFPSELKIEDHNDEYDSGWCMGHNCCLDLIINGGKY